MKKISVIMPVYNDKGFLRAMLQSLKKQTFQDFEVIIVNDGSTDGSEAIIDEFANEDSRFIKVNQKNQGVSAARNKALDMAKGEYLAFADADDLVPEHAYESLYQIASENKADLVVGGYKMDTGLSSQRNARMVNIAKKAQIQPDDEDLIHSFALWNKLFRREIVEQFHIRFEPLKHVEDAVFLYSYLQHARRIFTCSAEVYTYFKRIPLLGTSTTQTLRPGLLEDAIKAQERTLELISGWSEEFQEEMRYKFLNTTIIGDYYRRLWVLDADTSDTLFRQIRKDKQRVSEDNWERIVKNNEELQLEPRLREQKDIGALPLLCITLSPALNVEETNDILASLYNQNLPNFEVVADEAYRDVVPEIYLDKPNLRFIEGRQSVRTIFNKALDSTSAPYILFVDLPIVFDLNSLKTMWKTLSKADADFLSLRMIGFKNRKKASLWIMEQVFRKEHMEDMDKQKKYNPLDWMLCNKLFDTAALRSREISFSGNSAKDVRRCFASMNCKKSRAGVIAFLGEKERLIREAGDLNDELRREYQDAQQQKA